MAEAGLPGYPPPHAPFSEGVGASVRTRASRAEYIAAVTWLTLVLSGSISWAIRSGAVNTYYAMMACFLPYFVLFRLPQIVRLGTYPQFWLWVLTIVLPMLLYLAGQRDPWATETVKHRIITFSLVAGSALMLVSPDAGRMLRASALITLAIAIPIALIELVIPNIFSTAEGRSAGLYGNPNDAAAALIVCLLFAIDLRRVTTNGLVLISVGTAAVITTFSRSGMIFAAALWAWYSLLPSRQRSNEGGAQRIVTLVAIVFIGLIAVVLIHQYVNLAEGAIGRLMSLLAGDISDDSSMNRLDKVRTAVDLIQKHFWGQGMGYVERTGLEPHNTFLYLGLDYGIPGALFYTTILLAGIVSGLRAGWQRASNSIILAFLMIWVSLFTHYAAGAGFFAAAFAALATGALIHPREAPREVASIADLPWQRDPRDARPT